MNYLIVEDFSGQPAPFIFPRRVDHEDMREQLPYGWVISAIVVERGTFLSASGSHAELGMKARPEEDAAIICQRPARPLRPSYNQS
ncbi:MAG: hypothetical protein LBS77_06975 [Desulfovibrio sp.]|jgi:hypothetical protein|nr:hypothetical protein [Desulfovibrio sp.]